MQVQEILQQLDTLLKNSCLQEADVFLKEQIAAAEQAENFLNGTRLTASMVSAFIENVFVYDGGRIVVRFKYEQSIQDAVKAVHTG